MNEKIAVVVITRNREKMLAGCLESLVKQTYLPDEVIVIDNASTDPTKRIILSFKKRLPIRYVRESKIGIPYARNRGIKESSGTLLLMLDDDCEADKFWIEKMVEAHRKYPKAWAIQGRTFSLPLIKTYSLLAQYHRSFHFRNCAIKTLPLRSFFNKEFNEELGFRTCDTQNLSIKTSYLKKHNLSFDEDFYRGSDTDLGKQIIQKNGLIMFCPNIQVSHWERSSLKEFLKQRWHTGRTAAKIGNKWKMPYFTENILSPRMPFALLLFCKISNQLNKFPILLVLLLLERLYRINGYFFEKRIISLEKHI